MPLLREHAGTAIDMSDSGEWESVNIEVTTDDLCSVYGCNACPGFVKTEDGQFVFCDHECHAAVDA
jgi:hypothetical protein